MIINIYIYTLYIHLAMSLLLSYPEPTHTYEKIGSGKGRHPYLRSWQMIAISLINHMAVCALV